MTATKLCECCGNSLVRHHKDSAKQWAARQYCSRSCINRGRVRKSLLSRILDNVEPIPLTGCWIWMGSLDGYGYGQMASSFKESPLKAYRVAHELFNGPIPPGLLVRHKCDNTLCCNPAHLELGTKKDNSRDMVIRGRQNPRSRLNLRHGRLGHLGASIKSQAQKAAERLQYRQAIVEANPVLAGINFSSVAARYVIVDGKRHDLKPSDPLPKDVFSLTSRT